MSGGGGVTINPSSNNGGEIYIGTSEVWGEGIEGERGMDISNSL